MEETLKAEVLALLNEAETLLSQGNTTEAASKISAAKDKITLPIGGGTNGPIRP
jgi:hypothetical protein